MFPASRLLGVGLAAAALAGAALPANAGGGCRGQAVACYEKVRLPDVYRTVERPVVLRPARQRVVHVPAVIGTRVERQIVAPGRIHAVHQPAVHCTIMRREMVAPASVCGSIGKPSASRLS